MKLPELNIKKLNHLLGNIDIYLLDQILKGRFPKNQKILDVGCGEGRNLVYLIRYNYKVYGIDRNEDAISMLKYLTKSINRSYPEDRFMVGDASKIPFEQEIFGAVISSAVLHFAENVIQFQHQFSELLRVLKPGGLLFVRMATMISMEKSVKPIENGKYLLPDGSVRFLLTRELLNDIENQLDFIEPFKVVLVDNHRCMCTMVMKKPLHQIT